MGDYDNALARANAFDAQVKSDASEISSDYADWVALAVRQAFGAIEFTLSKDSAGNYNTSDILVFMKGAYKSVMSQTNLTEYLRQKSRAMACVCLVGSSRQCHSFVLQNVNTVDVIFPAWSIFLYTNPAIGKYLLLPLLEYQASGQYPNGWACHDMGESSSLVRNRTGITHLPDNRVELPERDWPQ